MPTSPPTACPCGGKRQRGEACDRCGRGGRKQARKAYDDRRGNAHKRGYTRNWRDYEHQDGAADNFLRLHPLCSECSWYGLVVPATLVDHKRPHKGDMRLFWDQENWQSLCRKCHTKKTQRELRTMPKYVICGPPGAGKSTWAKQHAQQGDLVFDADVLLATMFRTPMHAPIDMGLPLVMRLRDIVVDWLLNYPDRSAYVIVTAKDQAERVAEQLGAALVEIDACHKARTSHNNTAPTGGL